MILKTVATVVWEIVFVIGFSTSLTWSCHNPSWRYWALVHRMVFIHNMQTVWKCSTWIRESMEVVPFTAVRGIKAFSVEGNSYRKDKRVSDERIFWRWFPDCRRARMESIGYDDIPDHKGDHEHTYAMKRPERLVCNCLLCGKRKYRSYTNHLHKPLAGTSWKRLSSKVYNAVLEHLFPHCHQASRLVPNFQSEYGCEWDAYVYYGCVLFCYFLRKYTRSSTQILKWTDVV